MTSRSNANFYRESDNVYFNATITHPDGIYNKTPIVTPAVPSIGTAPVPAIFDVDNDTPFVENSSEYYASILRFDIPLNAVPLFICPIIPDQVDPNLTPFIIGINYNGVNTSRPIFYASDSSNNLVPPVQNQDVQIITPYYYVYSYTAFIDMVNSALSIAWVTAGLPILDTPYFYLEPSSGLLQLVGPPTLLPNILNPYATIYMNTPLSNYLQAFKTKFNGYNQPFGRDIDFVISSVTRANNKYPDAGVNWIRYSQDYVALQTWSSIRKLLVVSARLPVVSESISTGEGNSTRLNIMTEFVPIINTLGDPRSIAYYIPHAQYRLTDMIGNRPLQSFDLRFYWQDAQDNIYPLEITIFQQINIKIGFLRKDLYKNKGTINL